MSKKMEDLEPGDVFAAKIEKPHITPCAEEYIVLINDKVTERIYFVKRGFANMIYNNKDLIGYDELKDSGFVFVGGSRVFESFLLGINKVGD